MAQARGMQRRGGKREHRKGEMGKVRLLLVVVLLVCLGVATFFALGGDVDSDVTTPKGDIDVNTPEIDVKEPDISVDSGDVDVKPAPDADADADNGD